MPDFHSVKKKTKKLHLVDRPVLASYQKRHKKWLQYQLPPCLAQTFWLTLSKTFGSFHRNLILLHYGEHGDNPPRCTTVRYGCMLCTI